MIIIGLTGGIASGKSAAVNFIQERNIPVIDADKIAREIVAVGSDTLNEIVDEFGENVLYEDGSLNRKTLADIVFKDALKLERLNNITHKRIGFIVKDKLSEYERADENIVVIDAPLLIESGLSKLVDTIWVIDVDVETQIERVIGRENATEEEAKSRINSQLPREERVKWADVIIHNNDSLKELRKKVFNHLDNLENLDNLNNLDS